jgi:hypothetical protein
MKNAGRVFREQQDVSRRAKQSKLIRERLPLDADFKAEAENPVRF